MTRVCGRFSMSVPEGQFIPQGLHLMYELRFTRDLAQNGHAGSVPTSANLCSAVCAINLAVSIQTLPVPVGTTTLPTTNRPTLAPVSPIPHTSLTTVYLHINTVQ